MKRIPAHILILFWLTTSCKNNTEKIAFREKSIHDEATHCQLIEKSFSNKIGIENPELKELYLRCSIQDYYIKLCESKVQKADLLKYLNKSISVKMEVKEGYWDICPSDDPKAQSRIGNYVVITEIISN